MRRGSDTAELGAIGADPAFVFQPTSEHRVSLVLGYPGPPMPVRPWRSSGSQAHFQGCSPLAARSKGVGAPQATYSGPPRTAAAHGQAAIPDG